VADPGIFADKKRRGPRSRGCCDRYGSVVDVTSDTFIASVGLCLVVTSATQLAKIVATFQFSAVRLLDKLVDLRRAAGLSKRTEADAPEPELELLRCPAQQVTVSLVLVVSRGGVLFCPLSIPVCPPYIPDTGQCRQIVMAICSYSQVLAFVRFVVPYCRGPFQTAMEGRAADVCSAGTVTTLVCQSSHCL